MITRCFKCKAKINVEDLDNYQCPKCRAIHHHITVAPVIEQNSTVYISKSGRLGLLVCIPIALALLYFIASAIRIFV